MSIPKKRLKRSRNARNVLNSVLRRLNLYSGHRHDDHPSDRRKSEDLLLTPEDRQMTTEDRQMTTEDRQMTTEDRQTKIEDRLTKIEDRLTKIEDLNRNKESLLQKRPWKAKTTLKSKNPRAPPRSRTCPAAVWAAGWQSSATN